jgi:hypothetical protein
MIAGGLYFKEKIKKPKVSREMPWKFGILHLTPALRLSLQISVNEPP